MKLEDYLDILNVELSVRRYANQANRWCARFDGCEIKEGGCLTSAHGNGNSPERAIMDYIGQIRGKRIVFNAMDETRRREYVVPAQLAWTLSTGDGAQDGN